MLNLTQPWILILLQGVDLAKGRCWAEECFSSLVLTEKTLPKSSPQSWLWTLVLGHLYCKERWGEGCPFLFSRLSPGEPQANPVQGAGQRQKRLEEEEVTCPLQERWMLAPRALWEPRSGQWLWFSHWDFSQTCSFNREINASDGVWKSKEREKLITNRT